MCYSKTRNKNKKFCSKYPPRIKNSRVKGFKLEETNIVMMGDFISANYPPLATNNPSTQLLSYKKKKKLINHEDQIKHVQQAIEFYGGDNQISVREVIEFIKGQSETKSKKSILLQDLVANNNNAASYPLEIFFDEESLPSQIKKDIRRVSKISDFTTGEAGQLKNKSLIKYFGGFINLLQDEGEIINNWNKNIFSKSMMEEEKQKFAWSLFYSTQLTEKLKIPKKEFEQFIFVLHQYYNRHQNPFHNFDHGLTVAHSVFFFIFNKFIPHFDQYDHFSTLLAALSHDVDHTGKTNLFEINSISKLAIRYNDESVLENHHASTLFRILQDPNSNIFKSIEDERFPKIRKMIITGILCTDMKKHFDLLNQIENRMTQGEKFKNTQSDKLVLSGFLVHAADLSGPAQNWDIAYEWSSRVCREFSNQVQQEQQRNIPVTTYLLGLDNKLTVAKQEIGFIKGIIRPMWVLCNQVLDDQLKIAIQMIDKNLGEWEQIIQEETKQQVPATN